jgi:hypothetical protein
MEMGPEYSRSVPLVSMNSISKGFFGECGRWVGGRVGGWLCSILAWQRPLHGGCRPLKRRGHRNKASRLRRHALSVATLYFRCFPTASLLQAWRVHGARQLPLRRQGSALQAVIHLTLPKPQRPDLHGE